ncbi:hypothetical protein EYF80_012603 [Liparis tanakae]|uniref:Uncharacterized protein n=1 Tax=Liparis tanakae TaxID=230148 RepID=A0A4Z2II60_9TELE|nr:hypothetical protein EYF80_012603 [Liparis tanakae]
MGYQLLLIPNEGLLESFKKEELLKLADRYGVELSKKLSKADMLFTLKGRLVEEKVLPVLVTFSKNKNRTPNSRMMRGGKALGYFGQYGGSARPRSEGLTPYQGEKSDSGDNDCSALGGTN